MAKFFFTQEQNIELIVEGGKPMGGAVIATHVWMRTLHELGHTVVLFRNEEDDRKIQPEFNWVKPYKVYHSKKGIPMLRYLYYRYPKLLKALRDVKPDFLIESIPAWGSPLISLICRITKTKHLVRIASDNMLDERIKLNHSFFERKMVFLGFFLCDFIMTQNEYQFTKIKKRFPRKKILKISNPTILEVSSLKPKKHRKGYIAWVANFRYVKNFKLLFEIAEVLKDEKILIAGEPMREMDLETEHYMKLLQQSPNVKFVGTVTRDKIFDFFNSAKFLLNTSRYEGFSNTFLEAMCVGTPILTTSNVNPDGIILDFSLGTIYEDPLSLQQFLERLDDRRYTEMSQNCIRYVAEKHGHLALGRKLTDFLGVQ